MVSGGTVDEARVRIGLLRFPGGTAGGSHLATAIMARGVQESAGCHAGSFNLRSGDRVDVVDRGSGLYYAREFHELADILLHAKVRAVLAADAWVRFVIVPVTESHGNNCRLCGFLDRSSFLATVGLSQTVVSCCLYRRYYRLGTVAFWVETPERLNADIAMLVFPRQMVFLVALAIPFAGFLLWRSRLCARKLAILILMIFSPLLAFRILFGMIPEDYAIYYNGPVLVAFFLLLLGIAIPGSHSQNSIGARGARLFVCAAVCGWVTLLAIPRYSDLRTGRVAFESERGTIYVRETTLPAWADAVNFMRQAKQAGEAVMSIPEDTALYFFAGVLSPTRVLSFTPGTLSPGPMTAKTIAEMELVPVRYVIWSNRQFPEYGVAEFGVDFDVPFAEYIRRNYQPVREFSSIDRPDVWQATLWERKPGE